MHLLCQQSEEVLFSHFMTMLNAAFESKLDLEDEVYESGSENFNIPTPLQCVLLEYTMFPVMTTFLLTQSLPTAQIPASHIEDLFDVGYPSIPLMMKTVLQMTFHLPAAPSHLRNSWVLHS